MRMTEILQLAQSSRTSDIHIAPGNPLMLRIDGTLVPQGDVPLRDDDTEAILRPIIPKGMMDE